MTEKLQIFLQCVALFIFRKKYFNNNPRASVLFSLQWETFANRWHCPFTEPNVIWLLCFSIILVYQVYSIACTGHQSIPDHNSRYLGLLLLSIYAHSPNYLDTNSLYCALLHCVVYIYTAVPAAIFLYYSFGLVISLGLVEKVVCFSTFL